SVGREVGSPGGRKDRGRGDQKQSRCLRQSGHVRDFDLSLEGSRAKEPRGFAHYENKRTSIPCARALVRSMHSYEVPEIIALTVERGLRPYLEWVHKETATD